jgi:hypothetical protein
MVGMVLFTGGSLACGLAEGGTALIVFRALDVPAAAMTAPGPAA